MKPSNHYLGLLAAVVVALASIAPSRADSLLLRGATVHTVSGATLPTADVLVKDGKIAAIAASIG